MLNDREKLWNHNKKILIKYNVIKHDTDISNLSESEIKNASDIIFKYDLKTVIKLFSILSLYNPYRFGYSILTVPLLNKMKKYGPILEIGSGMGLNAKLLKMIGVKVKAIDQYKHKNTFLPVEEIDSIDAVKKYKNYTLFICWPSFNDLFAYYTLQSYTGSYFIYLGEKEDYACAEENFFNLLKNEWTSIYRKYTPAYYENMITFPNTINEFVIYKRK